VTIKFQSTFVRCEPIQIIEALVGLKDIRVLAYRRIGRDVELVIEQTVIQRTCPSCGGAGQIKERPTVRYVDLPVYGQPMRLAWRKHRLICRQPDCAGASWTSADHRIAAKNCLLTTRCAKWATVQVGTGRAVSDVAGELSCDWHTVNDAVMTYGRALLAADRRRLNATTAIGLDETSFVKLGQSPKPLVCHHRRRCRQPPDHRNPAHPKAMSTSPAGSTGNPTPGNTASASVPWTCRTPTPRSTP
jgi:hypothetical protein